MSPFVVEAPEGQNFCTATRMRTTVPEISAGKDSGPTLLNRQRRVRISAPPLRLFLERLREEVAGGSPFTLCLVSDAVMRRYNRRFRGKDTATDVLAFPDGWQGRAGDLLVSAETARRQARRLRHSLEAEIRVLALHGILHLLGYDHEAPGEKGRMARAERRWRRHFGLPQALTERSPV